MVRPFRGDRSVHSILKGFKDDLVEFQREKLEDWNALAALHEELKKAIDEADLNNDTKTQKKYEFKRDRVRGEMALVQKRTLHEELAKASILPIYGFPIDVVQLLTPDSLAIGWNSSNGNKHRLQRDRRLALGEYAPGQDVVVDDRVHRSVGILAPDTLPTRYYWVCKCCNYFTTASTGEEILAHLDPDKEGAKCPTCADEPTPAAARPRAYKIPKAFTTDWNETPKIALYNKPLRQPLSQVFLAREGERKETRGENFYDLTLCQGGEFFLSNQGSLKTIAGFGNKGFHICRICGRDLSDKLSKEKKGKNSRLGEHTHPITGRTCQGGYELIHLGHEFRSDFLKIVFTDSAEPPKLHDKMFHLDGGGQIISSGEASKSIELDVTDFWRSLTYALLAAAALVIDVPRSELDGLFRPAENSESGFTEIIIYDNVAGGAGYSKRIDELFPAVLERAFLLTGDCNCRDSCYQEKWV
ncbi:MAG: hypothetical protein N5P05_003641 [Chroococcopsis gigantea SAG 12.99]|jgi:hypothetical protein|nr:hypothetical protein [Chroococcopsis gigantea SAG 12.99]